MDHELTETQDLVRRSAMEFFGRAYPLQRMREIKAARAYDPELWQAVCEMGWTSLPFTPELAGVDGSMLDAAILVHELGRAAAVTPYVHSCIAAGLALATAAPGEVPAVADGTAVVIPAFPGAQDDQLTVGLSSDGARVSGMLRAVPWLSLATHLLVRHQGEWLSIRCDQASVSYELLTTSTPEPLAVVELLDAPAQVLPGGPATADPALLGAAGQAAYLAGLAGRSLEVAVGYANERVQFGRPIASFQALQHKAADMHIAVEAARDLAFKASWAHREEPGRFERYARYAKSISGDAAGHVTRQAIQLHGGVAFVDDHIAQLFYLNAISAMSTYGTGQEHRKALAQQLLAAG